MSDSSKNIIDIDENLRLVGTAHISSASVELVRNQIKEWSPRFGGCGIVRVSQGLAA